MDLLGTPHVLYALLPMAGTCSHSRWPRAPPTVTWAPQAARGPPARESVSLLTSSPLGAGIGLVWISTICSPERRTGRFQGFIATAVYLNLAALQSTRASAAVQALEQQLTPRAGQRAATSQPSQLAGRDRGTSRQKRLGPPGVGSSV